MERKKRARRPAPVSPHGAGHGDERERWEKLVHLASSLWVHWRALAQNETVEKVEKEADVMRRYRQVLSRGKGGERHNC